MLPKLNNLFLRVFSVLTILFSILVTVAVTNDTVKKQIISSYAKSCDDLGSPKARQACWDASVETEEEAIANQKYRNEHPGQYPVMIGGNRLSNEQIIDITSQIASKADPTSEDIETVQSICQQAGITNCGTGRDSAISVLDSMFTTNEVIDQVNLLYEQNSGGFIIENRGAINPNLPTTAQIAVTQPLATLPPFPNLTNLNGTIGTINFNDLQNGPPITMDYEPSGFDFLSYDSDMETDSPLYNFLRNSPIGGVYNGVVNPYTYNSGGTSIAKSLADNLFIPDSYTNYWGQYSEGGNIEGLATAYLKTTIDTIGIIPNLLIGDSNNDPSFWLSSQNDTLSDLLLPTSWNAAGEQYLDSAFNSSTILDTANMVNVFGSYDSYIQQQQMNTASVLQNNPDASYINIQDIAHIIANSPFAYLSPVSSAFTIATNNDYQPSSVVGNCWNNPDCYNATVDAGQSTTNTAALAYGVAYGAVNLAKNGALAALNAAFRVNMVTNTAVGTTETAQTCSNGDIAGCWQQSVRTVVNWALLGSMDSLNNAVLSNYGPQIWGATTANSMATGGLLAINVYDTYQTCKDGFSLNCGIYVGTDMLLAFGITQNFKVIKSLEPSYAAYLANQNAATTNSQQNLLTSSISQADDVVDGVVNNVDDMAAAMNSPVIQITAPTSNAIIPLTSSSLVGFNPMNPQYSNLGSLIAVNIANNLGITLPITPLSPPPFSPATVPVTTAAPPTAGQTGILLSVQNWAANLIPNNWFNWNMQEPVTPDTIADSNNIQPKAKIILPEEDVPIEVFEGLTVSSPLDPTPITANDVLTNAVNEALQQAFDNPIGMLFAPAQPNALTTFLNDLRDVVLTAPYNIENSGGILPVNMQNPFISTTAQIIQSIIPEFDLQWPWANGAFRSPFVATINPLTPPTPSSSDTSNVPLGKWERAKINTSDALYTPKNPNTFYTHTVYGPNGERLFTFNEIVTPQGIETYPIHNHTPPIAATGHTITQNGDIVTVDGNTTYRINIPTDPQNQNLTVDIFIPALIPTSYTTAGNSTPIVLTNARPVQVFVNNTPIGTFPITKLSGQIRIGNTPDGGIALQPIDNTPIYIRNSGNQWIHPANNIVLLNDIPPEGLIITIGDRVFNAEDMIRGSAPIFRVENTSDGGLIITQAGQKDILITQNSKPKVVPAPIHESGGSYTLTTSDERQYIYDPNSGKVTPSPKNIYKIKPTPPFNIAGIFKDKVSTDTELVVLLLENGVKPEQIKKWLITSVRIVKQVTRTYTPPPSGKTGGGGSNTTVDVTGPSESVQRFINLFNSVKQPVIESPLPFLFAPARTAAQTAIALINGIPNYEIIISYEPLLLKNPISWLADRLANLINLGETFTIFEAPAQSETNLADVQPQIPPISGEVFSDTPNLSVDGAKPKLTPDNLLELQEPITQEPSISQNRTLFNDAPIIGADRVSPVFTETDVAPIEQISPARPVTDTPMDSDALTNVLQNPVELLPDSPAEAITTIQGMLFAPNYGAPTQSLPMQIFTEAVYENVVQNGIRNIQLPIADGVMPATTQITVPEGLTRVSTWVRDNILTPLASVQNEGSMGVTVKLNIPNSFEKFIDTPLSVHVSPVIDKAANIIAHVAEGLTWGLAKPTITKRVLLTISILNTIGQSLNPMPISIPLPPQIGQAVNTIVLDAEDAIIAQYKIQNPFNNPFENVMSETAPVESEVAPNPATLMEPIIPVPATPNYINRKGDIVYYTDNYRELKKGTFSPRFVTPSNIILHWDGNPNDPLLHPEKMSVFTTYNGLSGKGSSVHFAVGYDGVMQFLPMSVDKITMSNGNSGLGDAINIEFSGQNFNEQLPPQEEIDAGVDLIVRLVKQYNLPIDQITHHAGQSDVSPEFLELIKGLVKEKLNQTSIQIQQPTAPITPEKPAAPPLSQIRGLGDTTYLFNNKVTYNHVLIENGASYNLVRFNISDAKFVVGNPIRRTTTTNFMQTYSLDIAINGDGFWRDRNITTGYSISNGIPNLKYDASLGEGIVYFDNTGKMRITSSPEEIPDYVQNATGFPNLLIKDGQIEYHPEKTDLNPRTAMGMTENGEILLIVVDGTEYKTGMTVDQLAEEMKKLGAVNAVMFDSGTSSTMVIKDKDVIASCGGTNQYTGQSNECQVLTHIGFDLTP